MPFLGRAACSAAIALGVVASPANAQKPANPAVVAVVAESSVDVLHREYRTVDGRDAILPGAIARSVVRVTIPRALDHDDAAAALARTPLGHPKADTLYYVSGTRLLVYYGATAKGSVLTDSFHGTGTTSLAAGRTVGAAPDALVVAVLGYNQDSWRWVADQPWIDVATTSTFDVINGALCDSTAAVRAFRRSGHLPFAAAGNSYVETTVLSPGGYPDVVRVGGVRRDGTTALPGTEDKDPTLYSARAYDVGGLFANRIAAAGTISGYTTGTGTSGSAPQIAGRTADLLARTRVAVGDLGSGVRRGALVWASKKVPKRGPLADGKLTADELLETVLHVSRPAGNQAVGRYAIEGYGWFDRAAQIRALAILTGASAAPARAEDDQAHEAALAARGAYYAAHGCDL